MSTRATFEQWDFAVDGEQFSIRGTRKTAVLGVAVGCVFMIFAMGMAYTMLTGSSSDWAPVWEKTGPMYPLSQHSVGDRIATYLFVLWFCGAFFVAGGAAAAGSLRARMVLRVFDKSAGVARLGRRQWPLKDVGALRLKPDTVLGFTVSLSLMVELATGKELRVIRSWIKKGHTASDQQALLEPPAEELARWLAVPLKFGLDPLGSGEIAASDRALARGQETSNRTHVRSIDGCGREFFPKLNPPPPPAEAERMIRVPAPPGGGAVATTVPGETRFELPPPAPAQGWGISLPSLTLAGLVGFGPPLVILGLVHIAWGGRAVSPLRVIYEYFRPHAAEIFTLVGAAALMRVAARLAGTVWGRRRSALVVTRDRVRLELSVAGLRLPRRQLRASAVRSVRCTGRVVTVVGETGSIRCPPLPPATAAWLRATLSAALTRFGHPTPYDGVRSPGG